MYLGKIYLPVIAMLLCVMAVFPQSTLNLMQPMPEHPRLLMTVKDQAYVASRIASDTTWGYLHQEILSECDRMLPQPVLERKQIGMRLLATSREALRRIFFLSYACRMTGEERYFNRAEAELLAVCRFPDWNPAHFLDVAEMLVAVSIGYDWLYDHLSDTTRTVIRDAIIRKGILPSTDSKYNWWLEAKHNWNQVCNAGVTFGALTVYEEDPFRFQRLIDRGLVSIRLSMKDYDPDGAYAEGYSYWEYGTTFNVLLLSAVEKVFHTDFGLSLLQGFSKTASYYEHMVGPTGKSFNYADCGEEYGLTPAMFWFAGNKRESSLLWLEKDFLEPEYRDNYLSNRVLPAVMIWGTSMKLDSIQPPDELLWHGAGTTPVAVMRTSWTDPQALYLGLKGGTASSNHAHMDAGSFVMDADGVRWAMDFGREDYERLESNRLHIWSNAQHSERWDVFRYNNFAHNTLSVNDSLHRVEGYAPLVSCISSVNFMSAVTDLTSVLDYGLLEARRGVAIVHKSYVVVRDEIKAYPNRPAKIRWNMLTDAAVRLKGKNRIELKKDGKTLNLLIDSPYPVETKTWSAQSSQAYDSPNPGMRFVGFEVQVPADKSAALTVAFLPQGAKFSRKDIPPLEQWK